MESLLKPIIELVVGLGNKPAIWDPGQAGIPVFQSGACRGLGQDLSRQSFGICTPAAAWSVGVARQAVWIYLPIKLVSVREIFEYLQNSDACDGKIGSFPDGLSLV